ncbi:restriction endonuclease subunit S [Bizionia sp. M204]|uniref:restriction endonuclease subunit S n=1 Tax=Bizionia sp. M204 TaxID=2675331 RepID=UPI0020BE6F13|nr:restriction endonuclease subunit S [Bizionia sp. M204]
MPKEKMLVPKLRFSEFEEELKNIELKKAATINPKSKELPDSFIYIDLESVENGILAKEERIYKNEAPSRAQRLLSKGDILYQTVRPYQMNNYFFYKNNIDYVASTGYAQIRTKNNSKYLYQYLHTFYFVNKVLLRCTGTSYPAINSTDLSKIKVNIPSLKEQQKIANFLTSIDTQIQTLEKKKTLLEQYKKGVIQKIFKQELRFKDEDGNAFPEWEKRKFSEVLFEHKLKSTGKEEVHSVSVHKGVINQIEHLGRSFSAKDTSHYSRVLPNDIIYTKSPTGDFPLGIIKQNHIKEDVIISPLYGVFTPETKELGYILHVYFESPINTSNYLSSIIQKGAKNTINITNTKFLSKKMLLPVSKEEQIKIANFLSAIDENIDLVNTKIEQTKSYKKGLLQQMFV